MLKLNYKATTTFTSADIKDLADNEPITYEVWANRPDGWTAAYKAFFESEGDSAALALDALALSLVAVSQGGERWPIDGRDGAAALRDSVEAQNPGYGDYFVRNLAMAVFDQQIQREDRRLGNSEAPLPASKNGNGREKSKLAAKRE